MDVTRRWLIAAALLFLLAGGCHHGGNLDLMERELRHHEDRIYQLQDYIGQYQDMLDSCRRENASLKSELERRGGPEMPERTPRSRTQRGGTLPAPKSELPLAPPQIEPGLPTPPDQKAPTPGPQGALDPDEPVEDLSAAVKSLKFNTMLSGGLDADGLPGDEGIMAVLEPRDPDGNVVPAVGELSLMVVDPSGGKRIARWDFTPAEAAGLWRKSLLGHGLHVELPWPGDPPQQHDLKLYARLITRDGRKFLAEHEVTVDPARGAPVAARPGHGVSPDGFVARPGSEPDESGWQRTAHPIKPAIPEPKEEVPTVDIPTEGIPTSVMRSARAPHAAPADPSPPTAATEAAAPADNSSAARPTWSPYR